MATVTVDLGNAIVLGSRIIWAQNVDIGSTFDADGLGQELSQTDIYFAGGNAGLVVLSISGPNNRFTPAFEASGRIIFEASDGETLEVLIADASMLEPYNWTPTNSAEVIAFGNHVSGLTDRTATLTLTDGPTVDAAPAFSDDTGDAQGWTVGTAIAPVTVPAASGSPAPTYAAVGSLPAGISFSPSTRVISGTPTATGSGTITIRATNSEGSDDWTIAYTVAAAPVLVPNQPTGLAASATFQVVSLTWDAATGPSVTSYQILRQDITGGGGLAVHIDSAPVGTRYDDSIDVDPENSYGYRIKARNAQGLSVQSAFVSVTTSAAPTTDTAPVFADNTGGTQRWTPNTAIAPLTVPAASGTPTPTYAVVGSLPAGIAFSTGTRVISGTPMAVGSGTIRIRATNSEGSDDWTASYVTRPVAAPGTQPTYRLTVDLDNDEVFAASESVTPDIISSGERLVATERGADPETPGGSAPATGVMTYTLNDGLQGGAGKYAPGGNLLAGRLTRLLAMFGGTTYPLWTGILESPKQEPHPFDRRVNVSALGTLRRLPLKKVSTELYEAITTDVAIGRLLDAGGWPKTMPQYVLNDLDSLAGYWRLGEASGVAVDSSTHGNDGTVTIGTGSRNAAALDDAGDGSIDFDGSNTKIEVPDAAAIRNLFDGGGSLLFLVDLDSDGESSQGRIIAKGDAWRLQVGSESGGNVRIEFRVDFDGARDGIWQTAVNIPINTTIVGVLTYDAGAVGNNPTLYLWNGTSLGTLTVGSGLTEAATPSGTRVSDVGSALVIGNDTGRSATFDGQIDEVALFGDVLTATEAARLIARAVDSPRHLDTGITVFDWWWLDEADAFQALKDILDSEGIDSQCYEDGSGAIVFRSRNAKSTEARSNTAQSTFRNAPASPAPIIAGGFRYDPGLDRVLNRVEFSIRERTATAIQTIWTHGDPLVFESNEVISLRARAVANDATTGFVTLVRDPFTSAVAPSTGAGDFTITAGSIASVTLDRTSGAYVTITLTAGAAGATIADLRLRARPVTLRRENVVVADDADSQETYGVQAWRGTPRAEISRATGLSLASLIFARLANGQPTMTVPVDGFASSADLTAALTREVGDRVTVIEAQSGLFTDGWIGEIHHVVNVPVTHRTEFIVNETVGGSFFILDLSELDSTDDVLG